MGVVRRGLGRLRRAVLPSAPPGPRIWQIDDLGLVFVHVPKTGTRSMRAALAEAALRDDPSVVDRLVPTAVERFERRASHETIRELGEELLTFAFVRHPLDRLHSAWKDKIRNRTDESRNLFAEHGLTLDATFDEFVRVVSGIPDEVADSHVRSQTSLLCDAHGLVVDHLGRFETLSQDWKRLTLPPHGVPDLPHRNSSGPSDGVPSWTAVYTPETWELAVSRYADDLATFGYDATPAPVRDPGATR